jgi:hypothetical protein
MKKYKFTIHAEFDLTETEVFGYQNQVISKTAEAALMSFADHNSCHDGSINRALSQWGLDLTLEDLEVTEVIQELTEEDMRTGHWKFED